MSLWLRAKSLLGERKSTKRVLAKRVLTKTASRQSRDRDREREERGREKREGGREGGREETAWPQPKPESLSLWLRAKSLLAKRVFTKTATRQHRDCRFGSEQSLCLERERASRECTPRECPTKRALTKTASRQLQETKEREKRLIIGVVY